jgi:hypothetical protein
LEKVIEFLCGAIDLLFFQSAEFSVRCPGSRNGIVIEGLQNFLEGEAGGVLDWEMEESMPGGGHENELMDPFRGGAGEVECDPSSHGVAQDVAFWCPQGIKKLLCEISEVFDTSNGRVSLRGSEAGVIKGIN